MPYKDGKRISNAEWTRLYGSIALLHTGPNGENPGVAPDPEEEFADAPKTKKKAGSNRSKRSSAAAKAAIADALGVKADSAQLEDIDLTGLDAEPEKKEAQ